MAISSIKHLSTAVLWAVIAIALCTVPMFTSSGRLWSQTGGTGAISGAITDPSAAMVVGAQVKVTEVATGYTRTVETNDHGLYVVSLLQPGQYKARSHEKRV